MVELGKKSIYRSWNWYEFVRGELFVKEVFDYCGYIYFYDNNKEWTIKKTFNNFYKL